MRQYSARKAESPLDVAGARRYFVPGCRFMWLVEVGVAIDEHQSVPSEPPKGQEGSKDDGAATIGKA